MYEDIEENSNRIHQESRQSVNKLEDMIAKKEYSNNFGGH